MPTPKSQHSIRRTTSSVGRLSHTKPVNNDNRTRKQKSEDLPQEFPSTQDSILWESDPESAIRKVTRKNSPITPPTPPNQYPDGKPLRKDFFISPQASPYDPGNDEIINIQRKDSMTPNDTQPMNPGISNQTNSKLPQPDPSNHLVTPIPTSSLDFNAESCFHPENTDLSRPNTACHDGTIRHHAAQVDKFILEQVKAHDAKGYHLEESPGTPVSAPIEAYIPTAREEDSVKEAPSSTSSSVTESVPSMALSRSKTHPSRETGTSGKQVVAIMEDWEMRKKGQGGQGVQGFKGTEAESEGEIHVGFIENTEEIPPSDKEEAKRKWDQVAKNVAEKKDGGETEIVGHRKVDVEDKKFEPPTCAAVTGKPTLVPGSLKERFSEMEDVTKMEEVAKKFPKPPAKKKHSWYCPKFWGKKKDNP